MAEAVAQNSDRIETDEEFRRKKRNCLAVGTLGLGFALATTDVTTSVPGLSDTKIQSWILGAGLLLYLAYTTIEYYHEYIQQRNLHSKLARIFSAKTTAITAIDSLILSLEATDLTLRSANWQLLSERSKIFSEMNETVNKISGEISSITIDLYEISLPENAKLNQEISSRLNGYSSKMYEFSRQIMDQQARDIVAQDPDSSDYYSRIYGNLQDLKNLFETNGLPSAKALTTLSDSLHRSDRLMFSWHDGIIPFGLAGLAGIALTISTAAKMIPCFLLEKTVWSSLHCLL